MNIPSNSSSLCVICLTASKQNEASAFAEQHQIPLFNENNNAFALQLIYEENKIELFDTELNTGIFVDFAEGTLAHRQQFGGGRGQPIARSIGIKKGNTPVVLDITAGLARDAYILATLGCNITLVEQSPVLVELIKDGVCRGLQSTASTEILKDNLTIFNTDAIQYLTALEADQHPDVIYMDPMYPERKKSALVKKDMRILQHLVGKDENTQQMLSTALNYAKQRVVVKRPVHAEPVSNIKPSTQISSKKTRYDIYIMK